MRVSLKIIDVCVDTLLTLHDDNTGLKTRLLFVCGSAHLRRVRVYPSDADLRVASRPRVHFDCGRAELAWCPSCGNLLCGYGLKGDTELEAM